MAQLAEQLICNQQVIGSSPIIGFIQFNIELYYGQIPEWPKGTDCKSAANCFDGSNPSPSICRSGGTGRRPGLKIPWVVIPVPVRSRFAARLRALIHTNRSSFSISIFQSPVPTTSLAAARSVLRDAAARRPSLLASMQYHSR